MRVDINTERRYWIALGEIIRKGPIRLLHHFSGKGKGSDIYRDIFDSYPEWRDYLSEALKRALSVQEECMRKNIEIICPGDEYFPERLLHAKPPVCALFLKGERSVLNSRKITVVGTRKPTPYGLKCTRWIAGGLVKYGIVVVSGMALGIDAEAHRSCLKNGGKTVAVLASGVDQPYPKTNRKIYDAILSTGGAVISEYPPGTTPRRYYFPLRNRIAAGISECVIVTEAPEKSGAIITALHALDMGIDVYVVPGPVDSIKSRGANRLISMGANPVIDVEEMVRSVFPDIACCRNEKLALRLSSKESAVVEAIKEGISEQDSLCIRTGMKPAELMALLTEMELKGLIEISGGRISLGKEVL